MRKTLKESIDLFVFADKNIGSEFFNKKYHNQPKFHPTANFNKIIKILPLKLPSQRYQDHDLQDENFPL